MRSSSLRQVLAATTPMLCAALLLGGCSGQRSQFPSLAVRPAELSYGIGPVSAPSPAPSAAAPAAATIARLSVLRGEVQAAHAQFEAAQGTAGRAVAAAAGTAVASEAWSVAQVRLAELESARSRGMIALADLDRMLSAAAVAAVDGPRADLDAVERVHGEVTQLIAAEDEALASLHARLRS